MNRWAYASSIALAAGAAAIVASCASILGYDELGARSDDALTNPDLGDIAPGESTDVGDGETGPTPAHPPARPAGAAIPSGKGKTVWLVIKRFYIGSENHAGAKINGAWKEWGYDVDSVCTGDKESKENIGTCRRVEGAAQDMLIDGDDCRDNNFGSHIVALVRVYREDFESEANANLLNGGSTWMLRLDDVDVTADDPYAPGKLYRVASVPKGTDPPKFDGTDVRLVSSDSVISGDITRPITTFPKGYIKGNVWVSGEAGKFAVLLPISDVGVPLQLVGGVLTLPLDAARKSGNGVGVLAGAIPTSSLEATIKPVAISAKLCPGSPIYVSTVKTIQQFPDLVAGAPGLQDVNVTCDAVSIGLGFEVAPVAAPTTVIDPPIPPPNACGDAG